MCPALCRGRDYAAFAPATVGRDLFLRGITQPGKASGRQDTANTRGHKIEISANGKITITNRKTGQVELSKP